MTYEDFIETKRHTGADSGIAPLFYPSGMFDFQRHIAERLIRKGRGACFVDTGLGKTLIELTIAANYARATNRRVLILTPLAVAYQFITEAEKFGIDDVSYSRDGAKLSKITLCNYEQLHRFDSNDFDCVIADESSILKNYQGAIKRELTAFLRKIRYRYLATATPSPNDYIELGTSSEALGNLGYMEMLTKFFSNNENNISPLDIGNKWYLKPHAKNDFFEWVSGWSISMRKPSDLGFDDALFKLPKLITRRHDVENIAMQTDGNQLLLFNKVARRLTEVRNEQKETIESRCNYALELAKDSNSCVYWTNLNQEGDLIEKIDSDAVQIKGGMKLEKKEEILVAFQKGELKRLVTKPKITAFGLNWQHCNHTIYFPTFSYEQYYQAIRRFWRFGQKKDVICDLVYSEGQKRVIDILSAKSEKADELYTSLNNAINQKIIEKSVKYDKKVELPSFIRG